jgi:hypothetical protein
MNELTETKLTRPLDKAALGNDAAMLRNLTGMLNDPRITGAEVPGAEKRKPFPSANDGGPTIPPEVIPAQDDLTSGAAGDISQPLPPPVLSPASRVQPVATATPAPASAKLGLKLFFTGRNVDQVLNSIPCAEFGILKPVARLAEIFFPGISFGDTALVNTPGAAGFIASLRAWGAGEVSEAYPITDVRACFVTMMRSLAPTGFLPKGIDWSRFGAHDGFWIDVAVIAAQEFQKANPNARFAITGVTTQVELMYFRTLGLAHWHVMARPGVGISNPIALALDNDVTAQISRERTGKKLRCIWNDSTPPASPRLWSAAEFRNAATV